MKTPTDLENKRELLKDFLMVRLKHLEIYLATLTVILKPTEIQKARQMDSHLQKDLMTEIHLDSPKPMEKPKATQMDLMMVIPMVRLKVNLKVKYLEIYWPKAIKTDLYSDSMKHSDSMKDLTTDFQKETKKQMVDLHKPHKNSYLWMSRHEYAIQHLSAKHKPQSDKLLFLQLKILRHKFG